MYSNYRAQTNTVSLQSALKAAEANIFHNLNCVRIGIVEEFDQSTLIAKIKIANKMQVGQNADGTPILLDYPPIFAKVYFIGWQNVGITYPLTAGMEGILLFNDREIESWYINGDVNPLAYERSHSWSDAIFLCGLRSLPNMITMISDCLNLFYGSSSIQIADETIAVVGDTEQTGNSIITGTLTADGIADTTGATGSFQSQDNKTITVQNGIIKSIQ